MKPFSFRGFRTACAFAVAAWAASAPATAQVVPVRLNVSPVPGMGLAPGGMAGVESGAAGMAGMGETGGPALDLVSPAALPNQNFGGTPSLALPPSAILSPGALAPQAAAQVAPGARGAGMAPADILPVTDGGLGLVQTRSAAGAMGLMDSPALARRQPGQGGEADAEQKFEFRGRQTGIGPLIQGVLASWQNRKPEEAAGFADGEAAFSRGQALADQAYAGRPVTVPPSLPQRSASGLLGGMAARISERRAGTPPAPLVLRALENSPGQDLRFVIEQLGPAARPSAAASLVRPAANLERLRDFAPPPAPAAWSLASPDFLEFLASLKAYYSRWWSALALLTP